MNDDRVQRLTELLRSLRRRLDDSETDPDPETWELDLYSYDEALITAADLFEVEVPPGAREEMNSDQRAQLEEDLVAAGLDLRVT